MRALPAELHAGILDMACRKQHNGAGSRYGLIVALDIDFAHKIEGELERALEAWVWDSLDRAHRSLDFQVPWHFVQNVRHDQWNDDYTDAQGNPVEGCMNTYQVCVHIEPKTHTGVLPLFTYAPQHEVDTVVEPARVLEHFVQPPPTVRGVAVSGVCQALIRDEWAACIAQEHNSFDRTGSGYMRHAMYTLPEEAQADTLGRLFSQRETSCNFGWPGYPGLRG